jgi:hypothetical protein
MPCHLYRSNVPFQCITVSFNVSTLILLFQNRLVSFYKADFYKQMSRAAAKITIFTYILV